MKKKLIKSQNDRIFSGCLGGVAEYIGCDATVVRIAYVALSLFSAGLGGLIFYIVMCAVIPNE